MTFNKWWVGQTRNYDWQWGLMRDGAVEKEAKRLAKLAWEEAYKEGYTEGWREGDTHGYFAGVDSVDPDEFDK